MVDNIKSESLKMISEGFILGIANDLAVKGHQNFLQNVRVFSEGVLESRPLLDDFLALDPAHLPNSVPHSIKTIIDKSSSSINRIVGAGTQLFTGSGTPLLQKDTGYSGNPFFLVDFRPENAVETYLYLTEGQKFKKISVNNSLSDVGITPPSFPVTWKISKPDRKIIDKISTGSDTDWNHLTGSAAAPALFDRVNTTITKFLADDTVPNFASIVPAAFTSDIQAGMTLFLNGADDIIVDEVIPSSLNTSIATISKIVYDNAPTNTGLCTIVLSVSSTDIVRNSILFLNGTEYVRVIEVTLDDNSIPSIRTSTVGTFAAGNTVSGASSFRFYATNSYAATNTITGKALKSAISAAGVSSITRTFNVDLLNTGSSGRPLTMEDIFHISLQISSIANFSELQILLDVDSGDFLKNWYQFVIVQNFFTSSALQTSSTLSVIQQEVQRQQLLRERQFELDLRRREGDILDINIGSGRLLGDSVQETVIGASQWTESNIRLGDFKKFGADSSKTLKDVKAIRISVTTTGALDLSIDSLWVGGADVLDNNPQGFLPYNYVYQIYDPATRATSNWSPPLRKGIKLTRGKVELSFPNINSLYSTDYKIRIARFGGSLNDFRILGTIKNDGSTYIDNSSDRLLVDNDLAGRFEGQGATDAVFDFYKPFTILDGPKVGTCNIVGTTFTRTGGNTLDVTYPRGTQIVINGKANSFYSNPSTFNIVELEQDMGALTNVVFEIQAPLLTGQPLPVIFGPFGEGNFGLYIFGLGDKLNAGTLYWLDGNSPDTMSDLNRLEITPPSEPLISGVLYDGFGFVWSTQRSFMIVPTQAADGSFSFIARENANSRGLFSRYTIAVGPAFIYFISENADGIYRVQGTGNPECITNAGFNNFFFVNGEAPKPITLIDGTIIYPPNLTSSLFETRLFCIDDFLFFRFLDTDPDGAKAVVLAIDCKTNNIVSYDTYPSNKVNVFYREETDSGSYTVFTPPDILTNTLEASTRILVGTQNAIKTFGAGNFEPTTKSKVIPFAFDAGDSATTKEFRELMISAAPSSNSFSIQNFYDNGDTFDSLQPITGSSPFTKRSQFTINLQDVTGQGRLAQNITTVFSWIAKDGVKLFEEQFYYIPLGYTITNSASGIEFGSEIGDKLWQGVVIEANTFNVNKVLKYYDDRNILRATITIKHNGKETIAYSFPQPFISHSILRISDDDVAWLPIEEAYINDPEPESAKVWEGEFDTGSMRGTLGITSTPGLNLIKRMAWAYRSTADAIIKLIFDDETFQQYDLPNSDSKWHKELFYTTAKKWLGCKYRIETSGEIRVYKKHCEVWLKAVNSSQGFLAIQSVGGPSNLNEAQI